MAEAGHPAGSSILQEASDAMGLDVVAGCHDDDALATTAFVQPALLACDVAAFHVLEAEGVAPLGVAGHSLGQFAALAADVVLLADALDPVAIGAPRCSAPGRSVPER